MLTIAKATILTGSMSTTSACSTTAGIDCLPSVIALYDPHTNQSFLTAISLHLHT